MEAEHFILMVVPQGVPRLEAIERELPALVRCLSPIVKVLASGLLATVAAEPVPPPEPTEEEVLAALPPFERTTRLLETGVTPGENLIGRLSYREIDKLESRFRVRLSFSSGDPLAPWNRNRRAAYPECF